MTQPNDPPTIDLDPSQPLEERLTKLHQFSIRLGAELHRLQKFVLQLDDFAQAMSDDLGAVEHTKGLSHRTCGKCGRLVRAANGVCGYCGGGKR